MQLPSFIPIFPLPNVVLFPEVPLPLHIFEPRYCAMVRDALAGHRLIGMVLLREGWEDDYHAAPDVYRVGCAGRIVETTPLPDGKFNIVLAGIREFAIQSEQRERAYRQATVVWRDAPAAGRLTAGLRTRLVETIERYVGRSEDDVTRQMLGDARLDDRALVNFFAFWLGFSPIEKQCLLEASDEQRASRLLEILEFQRYGSDPPLAGAGQRRVH